MEPLLTDCRNLMREISNKQITHVYREANQCVNALTKLGASSLSSFVVFLKGNDMFTTFLQQILNGRLLLVIIVRAKK